MGRMATIGRRIGRMATVGRRYGVIPVQYPYTGLNTNSLSAFCAAAAMLVINEPTAARPNMAAATINLILVSIAPPWSSAISLRLTPECEGCWHFRRREAQKIIMAWPRRRRNRSGCAADACQRPRDHSV